MPRPRAFDEADVLDAAVDCFWRRGLEATSIRDLAAEMGINCPSLYNAFGDKRALFARVLEHYVGRFTRERIRLFEEMASPKAAIRAYFDELIARSLGDPERRGCLIINAAIEIAPGDDDLRAALAGYFREIESFFRRRLEAAQVLGEIPASLPPADTARLLFAVMLGIRVAARTRPERDLLEGMAGPALALLDPPDFPA
jgi:TetR/AcrR family transcriptional repressor of nem operon